MKSKFRLIVIAMFLLLIGIADWAAHFPISGTLISSWQSVAYQPLPAFSSSDITQSEAEFQARSLAIREKLAAEDLDALDSWWRSRNIADPHKYLLPVILSRLSLGEQYNPEHSWQIWLTMDRDKKDLYHFRSPYDVRIFFLFQNQLPQAVEESFRSMVDTTRVGEWMEQGTENHMFMQRISGLALMDGSGFFNRLPATASTNEAWLRSELNKFLTLGQGEFHSSTYYGYSIGGLLNLYDFARTPERRQLAKAALDWYAVNIALRFSWGTAGGVESRGFDRGTWDYSGISGIAWMWWGENPEIAQRMEKGSTRVAVLAGLSSYRPPPLLKAIARKEIPLPFELKASHPGYFSYSEDNQFWETFYVTQDYSLGTLLNAQRSYQTEGTINAQYATYKLVIRDDHEVNNAVISLAGTFHSPMATGHSPGDQYVQKKGAVIYQLRLNERDQAAGVPQQSHLVLPSRYGEPQRYHHWYIWRIENVWFCAYPWGDEIRWQGQVSDQQPDYQVLAAIGKNTAWITDLASISDYPHLEHLQQALDQTQVSDRNWEKFGQLRYTSLTGDHLEITYQPNSGVGKAKINGKEQVLKDWAVLDSPYVNEALKSGRLEVVSPEGRWRLQQTLTEPIWEEERYLP